MAVVMTLRHKTIPDEYMQIAGSIIVYWATLEHEMVDIIGTALRIGKKERRILMAKMDPKAKVSMLKVIGSKFIKRVELRQHINNLSRACNGLYDLRNMFAHGAWVHPVDQPNEYQLLVIDSGEAAYNPKRMLVTPTMAAGVIKHYADTVNTARIILGMVIEEVRGAQVDDDEGGVSSGPVTDAPLEIPKNVPDDPQ